LRRVEPIGLLEGRQRILEAPEHDLREADVAQHQSVPRIEAQRPASHQAFGVLIGRGEEAAIGLQHRDVIRPRPQRMAVEFPELSNGNASVRKSVLASDPRRIMKHKWLEF
jgi:hypothetical protein